MARHAASNNQRRGLLRLGVTVVAAGAALGAGGTAAQAAPAPSAAAPSLPLVPVDASDNLDLTAAFEHALPGALGPAKDLQLYPLANTGVDPLDNAVGTQIADFKPLSTAVVTDLVTRGGGLRDLPLAGPLSGVLPG
jgi:hypothetical protein